MEGTINNHEFCIYETKVDDRHYEYGVVSYMYLDLPLISDVIKIPIYSKTDRVFRFTE
jgi:hypothetical protein